VSELEQFADDIARKQGTTLARLRRPDGTQSATRVRRMIARALINVHLLRNCEIARVLQRGNSAIHALLHPDWQKKRCRDYHKRGVEKGEVATDRDLAKIDSQIASGERCKCGLLKPCNNCLPDSCVDLILPAREGRTFPETFSAADSGRGQWRTSRAKLRK
jgi:hypothetical protein